MSMFSQHPGSLRPSPPFIKTASEPPSSAPDSRDEQEELEEEGSSAEEQVDELESDASGGEESAEENYRPGEGRRRPGDPLLPAVRVENILNADGVVHSLGLSRDGLFIVQAATEEFIKRLTQGGHRQAYAEGRNTVMYRDMANTTRQYQEFMFLTGAALFALFNRTDITFNASDMIPAPIALADALELRKERNRSILDDDLPLTHPATRPHPHNQQPAASSSAPPKAKSKHRLNGQETTNGFVHTTVLHPAPNGPAHGSSAVVDARPWTHYSEPISFQTTRPAPMLPLPSPHNGHSLSSSTRTSEGADMPPPPVPGHLAGPASGFVQPPTTGPSMSGETQNPGRTIYS